MLVQHGYKLVFESNKVVITKGMNFIGKSFLCDGLFKLNVKTPALIVLNVESPVTWHQRLGHVNFNSIKKLMHLNLIPKFDIKDHDKCQICVEAKQPRRPFKTIDRDSEILELTDSDVCDSGRISRGGNKYFVTFIDDFSNYCHLYLIKSKDEVINKFKIYKAEVENQLEKKIKILRSDRRGEYTSHELRQFCKEHGIIHELTAPYTPQSNGVAERKNRTLMDMVNSMLINSGVLENLWGEALMTHVLFLTVFHSNNLIRHFIQFEKIEILIWIT